jgi:hypothetical protein
VVVDGLTRGRKVITFGGHVTAKTAQGEGGSKEKTVHLHAIGGG